MHEADEALPLQPPADEVPVRLSAHRTIAGSARATVRLDTVHRYSTGLTITLDILLPEKPQEGSSLARSWARFLREPHAAGSRDLVIGVHTTGGAWGSTSPSVPFGELSVRALNLDVQSGRNRGRDAEAVIWLWPVPERESEILCQWIDCGIDRGRTVLLES